MMSHSVERVLPYGRGLLFDIAADVERYQQFLPSWTAARVTRREGNAYWTDQEIGLGPLRARFGSKTVLNRPERIDVASTEMPFRSFHLSWTFEPRPNGGTRVSLAAELELRSSLLERLVEPVLEGIIAKTIAAFEAQAARLPSVPVLHEHLRCCLALMCLKDLKATGLHNSWWTTPERQPIKLRKND